MKMEILASCMLFAAVALWPGCSADAGIDADNDADRGAELPSGSGDDAPGGAGTFIIKGGDISWITEMEAQGIKFYYANGKEGDVIEILRSLGMNAFRFRVWVNPSEPWNALPDVIAKAERAWKSGARIMIDFHYSDNWADPGKQTIPSAWSGYNLDDLCDAVAAHTRKVLNALKDKGIRVDWVQVGNETSNGMLWPAGKADVNPAGYARLNNAGYDAVKEVFPDAQVIVHLANAQKLNDATWLLGLLSENGGKWDIIGLSLYPEPTNYETMVATAGRNIGILTDRYNCPAMLCEVGMGEAYETECYDFLRRCFNLVDEVSGGRYAGTLYWEPQCFSDFNSYKKGAFTNQGRPGRGLDAYGVGSGVPVVTVD